jgi:hypothetical protein
MGIALAILAALVGVGLIVLGLGYAAAFVAARKIFDRALASDMADQSKAYVENAVARIKSDFVRNKLIGRLGPYAGAAAVSFVRGELSSSISRGLFIAGAGVGLIVLSFFVPTLIAVVWPK